MKPLNVQHFSLFVFILLFCISMIDIIYDFEEMETMNSHIWVELSMGLIALGAFGILLISIYRQTKNLSMIKQDLNKTQQALDDATVQTQKLRSEFSNVVQNQLDAWQLTQSEKEVALLLLKGLSLEEVAQVRNTKEKTVRQQASNLYKKASVAGRHELSAFFFEDLLSV